MTIFRRVLLVICILGFLASAGGFMMSKIEAAPEPIEVYTVKAFSKDEKNIEDMKKLLEAEGIEYESKKVQRYKASKIGNRVVFFYQDEEALNNMKDLLQEKKVASQVLNEEGQLYIQIIGNFKDIKKAENVRKKVSDLTFGAYNFEVQDYMKKYPYTTNGLIVRNIYGLEKATHVEELLAPHSQEEVHKVKVGELIEDNEGNLIPVSNEPDDSEDEVVEDSKK